MIKYKKAHSRFKINLISLYFFHFIFYIKWYSHFNELILRYLYIIKCQVLKQTPEWRLNQQHTIIYFCFNRIDKNKLGRYWKMLTGVVPPSIMSGILTNHHSSDLIEYSVMKQVLMQSFGVFSVRVRIKSTLNIKVLFEFFSLSAYRVITPYIMLGV